MGDLIRSDLDDSPYNHDLDHPTEAARFDSGKPRVELVPPELLETVAAVFTFGAKKYNDWNWAKGFPWLQPYASCVRHLLAWHKGEDLDPESGLPHLAHAACNLAMLLHFARQQVGQDNRLRRDDEGRVVTP